MVNDQFGRLKRIDLLGVSSERLHCVAHCGEVNDGGHAGEVLHQHARGAILDLLARLRGRVPVGEPLNIGSCHGDAVLVTKQVLQQNLRCIRQPPTAGDGIKAVDFVGLASDLQRSFGVERVGHGAVS